MTIGAVANPGIAPGRLVLALEQLPPAQAERLIAQARKLDPAINGLKSALVRLARLPTPSVLSDILAGRNSGAAHRLSLARLVGVDPAWLGGDDRVPPDWALPALRAFLRWRLAVREAWERRTGIVPGASEESDSGCLPILEPCPHTGPLEQVLHLPPVDPLIQRLGRGEWRQVPFTVLEALGAAAGLPPPFHRDHLIAGHAQADLMEAQIDEEVQTLRRRTLRLEPPSELADVMRSALMAQRDQRLKSRQDTRATDDALELFWRRQRRQMPVEQALAGLRRDTGRAAWTPLAILRGRYVPPSPDAARSTG